MADDINTLRSELFATLRALRDQENPMELARAKAVSDVAQTIINSAKVEVDMINAVGARHMAPSGFLGGSSTPRLQDERQVTTPKPGNGLPPRGPTPAI